MTKRQAEKAVVRAAMRITKKWDAESLSDGWVVGQYLTLADSRLLWKSCARLAKLRGKK